MPSGDNGGMFPEKWTIWFDPCFDPYGIITQWTGQISVDAGGGKLRKKAPKR